MFVTERQGHEFVDTIYIGMRFFFQLNLLPTYWLGSLGWNMIFCIISFMRDHQLHLQGPNSGTKLLHNQTLFYQQAPIILDIKIDTDIGKQSVDKFQLNSFFQLLCLMNKNKSRINYDYDGYNVAECFKEK